ncbi:MAG: tRNA pseudouridine(55) synthase, partial [Paludibacter sp.]|nr:tRNA pseudouridine(55) synthase [Paludibacter sp.]
LKLRVVCSKGTYIRALARDIGLALNSGAHLAALERTRIGDIRLEDCLEINELIDHIEYEMIKEKNTTDKSVDSI